MSRSRELARRSELAFGVKMEKHILVNGFLHGKEFIARIHIVDSK
jgi:hypothetical protein